jgi:hypothetical protein
MVVGVNAVIAAVMPVPERPWCLKPVPATTVGAAPGCEFGVTEVMWASRSGEARRANRDTGIRVGDVWLGRDVAPHNDSDRSVIDVSSST